MRFTTSQYMMRLVQNHDGSYLETDTFLIANYNILWNQVVDDQLFPNDYVRYILCIPAPPSEVCQDVRVTLFNNESLSEPELLISRSEINVGLKSNSWKLATADRRHIDLLHSDPEVQ